MKIEILTAPYQFSVNFMFLVMTPKESRMVLESRARVMADGGIITLDNCPILPQNGKELKEMFDVCLYTAFKCPQSVRYMFSSLFLFSINLTDYN